MKYWKISALILMGLPAMLLAHEGRHAPLSDEDRVQIEQRIETFEKRLQINPQDVHALEKLGNLYEELGRLTGAHTDFRKSAHYFEQILTMLPEHPGSLRGQCRTALARHQFHQGLIYARRLAELARDESEAWLLLGDSHFFLGNYADAASHFQRAFMDQENLGTLARMAQLHEARGDYPKAYQFMEKALVMAGKDETQKHQAAWVLTMLAELDIQTNRMDAAENRFQESLKLDPEMHYAYGRLAQIHRQKGNLNKARSLLHDLVHQKPRVSYFVSYGQLWQDLNRQDRARFWFKKAEDVVLKEIKTGDYGHVRELVALWAHTGQNLGKALVLAKKEYDDIRRDAEGAEWLGWLYYLNGKPKEGLPFMRRALRLGTSTPRFMLRAAIVSHEAGDYMLAAHLLRLANPENTVVDARLMELASAIQASLKKHPEKIHRQFTKQLASK